MKISHFWSFLVQRAKKEVTAVCEVDKRIAFLDARGGPQGSPRYNNDFLYLGQNVELFQEVFKPLGEVR